MKTYRVQFTSTEVSEIEVEAKNKKEAEAEAQIQWNGGDDGEYISSQSEITGVKEVK